MITPTQAKAIDLRRQAVLSTLYECSPQPAYSQVIAHALGHFYIGCPRDLQRDLHYLGAKGLTQSISHGMAWSITSRGVDVLLGHIIEPGIEPSVEPGIEPAQSIERCEHCGAPRCRR